MSLQNVIVKGKDNPVIIKFSFTGEFATLGLNNFSRVVVEVGGETYDSDLSTAVAITANDELRIMIGDTTSLNAGFYQLTITGYSATYDDGYELTSEDNALLSEVKVI